MKIYKIISRIMLVIFSMLAEPEEIDIFCKRDLIRNNLSVLTSEKLEEIISLIHSFNKLTIALLVFEHYDMRGFIEKKLDILNDKQIDQVLEKLGIAFNTTDLRIITN